jgi:hypothetical protein
MPGMRIDRIRRRQRMTRMILFWLLGVVVLRHQCRLHSQHNRKERKT